MSAWPKYPAFGAVGTRRRELVECPVCGRRITLTSIGFIRAHKAASQNASGSGVPQHCDGSGRVAAAPK